MPVIGLAVAWGRQRAQLAWIDAPAATRSFVLIMDDPDAPGGTFTHWLLYDLPGDITVCAAGQKPGQTGKSLKNDFGRPGYGGPCPPRGHGRHRYVFTLHALDVSSIGAPASRSQLETAMKGHVLATASIVGTYERKR